VSARAPATLELDGVCVQFGGVNALNDVSVQVEQGNVLGLIGPNGAGKTTLLNVVSGLVRPAVGKVTFRGDSLAGLRPDEIARRGVARTFQLADGFSDFSVRDYVRLGLAASGRNRRSRRGAAAASSEALEQVGLRSKERARVGDLPYGDRKLLDIARAVVTRPVVLLLDEPTSGLTGAERDELKGRLGSVRDYCELLVVVDHDVGFITGIADSVLALGYGQRLAFGRPAEVLNNPDVIAAYLG
jgi:branched-chain amino acid transport system ATP-binding protein